MPLTTSVAEDFWGDFHQRYWGHCPKQDGLPQPDKAAIAGAVGLESVGSAGLAAFLGGFEKCWFGGSGYVEQIFELCQPSRSYQKE